MPAAAYDERKLLRQMLEAREGDRRQALLMRQNRGWFHLSSEGHEAMAALATALLPNDYTLPHYRDRAFLLARGMTTRDFARDFFAKAASHAGGRNLPSHVSDVAHGIVSIASPTGSQCLPAAGFAWGQLLERSASLKRHDPAPADAPQPITVCSLGDAACRQGEFYEAFCFAVQEALPLLIVVEDNGYGISTPTERHLPMRLGIFREDRIVRCDARRVPEFAAACHEEVARIRAGHGPRILWCELDRVASHTSSDDHRNYRPPEDIEALQAREPVQAYARQLIEEGKLDEAEWQELQQQVTLEVRQCYDEVEREADPGAADALLEVIGPAPDPAPAPPMDPAAIARQSGREDGITMVEAINHTFRAALEKDPRTILFGEDIEDPKGGVFRFTAGLSSDFPGRVVNSPLAEASIVGLGVGLAAMGYRPVFEIQFIDFIAPAFNQLYTQASTMRWRSRGEWKCPLVLYAPCGAYLPGGSIWHSQCNEGLWAHIPGLRVVIPSTPEDAAGLFWTALHADDPTLILVPKHLFRIRHQYPDAFQPVPFGKAAVRRSGEDLTLLSWSSCLDIAREATDAMAEEGVSVELIDARSIVPFDWDTLEDSVARTGRLVVLHEDNQTCGFGQAVLSEIVSRPERFDCLLAPPRLLARKDVQIPFRPDLEYAVLPDLPTLLATIRECME